MKRLILHSFSLDALQIEDGPTPATGEDTALVRVKAAGLNPSDLMNIKGAFHYTTLPRVPGRDYAGLVEKGPKDWVGRSVWGSGAELGFSQDGTYAEFVTVPAASLVEKPANLSFAAAAAAGVPFATAYQSLVQAARIQAGEIALITGAAGAVGSAACQIALERGARVLGLVKDPGAIEAVEMIRSDEDVVARVRELTGGRGVDVCLDTVSGPVFPAAIASLAIDGRLAIIVAKGDGKVTLDLRDLYRRRLQLLGINTLLVNTSETAAIYRKLSPLFEAGKLRSAEPAQISFADIHSALKEMEKGSIPKTVLVP